MAGGKNCLIPLVTLDHDEIYEIDILSCARLGMGKYDEDLRVSLKGFFELCKVLVKFLFCSVSFVHGKQ